MWDNMNLASVPECGATESKERRCQSATSRQQIDTIDTIPCECIRKVDGYSPQRVTIQGGEPRINTDEHSAASPQPKGKPSAVSQKAT